jgi:hypothetical protein
MDAQRFSLLSVMQTFNKRVYEGKPVVLFERNQRLLPPPEPVKAVPVDRMCSECRLELSATEFDGGGDVCRWCKVRARKPSWRTCTTCQISKVIEDFSPTRIGSRMRVCKPCIQQKRNLRMPTPRKATHVSSGEGPRTDTLLWAERCKYAFDGPARPACKPKPPRYKRTLTWLQFNHLIEQKHCYTSSEMNPKPRRPVSPFIR